MSSERKLRLGAITGLAAVTALALGLVVASGAPASAGKPPKQTLQKLADDPVACPDGSYLRLDPSGTGVWECLTARDLFFEFALHDGLAIAYINRDGTNGFNPFDDTLIAKLVDTDGNGQPSVGDHLITNKYPANYSGKSGALETTFREVTEISIVPQLQIAGTAEGVFFRFLVDANSVVFDLRDGAIPGLLLVDGDVNDAIVYDSDHLSGETGGIFINLLVFGGPAVGDNDFLNIDFLSDF